MSGVLTPLEWRVLAAIEKAASNGSPFPKNDEIRALINANSNATAARIVNKLERLGFITVLRFTAGREATISATGLSTAPYDGKRTLHHAQTPSEPVPAPEQVVPITPMRPSWMSPDDIEQRRVRRDPCPRCGTRGDYGCEHQRLAA